MTNIEFWGTLIGLFSNLILAIIAIYDKKNVKILKGVIVILSFLIILFVTANQQYQKQKVQDIKTEIVSFIKSQNTGYQYKTLSEITEHLRRNEFDETMYSIAITDMLKQKILTENKIILYGKDGSMQDYSCFLYSIPDK